MKAIPSLAFAIVSSVGACIGATSVASLVLAEPAQTPVSMTLSTPDLWTNKPVRVDLNRQNYQRLPAVYSTYVTDPVRVRVAAAQPIRMEAEPLNQRPGLSTAHLDWCASRYRSYDPSTNTYRSYSGQIRSCSSPYEDQIAINESGSLQPDSRFSGYGADNQHAAWCAARYQSYRADDNTYQPYDGPRRPCTPPQETRLEATNTF
jgi:hypothetical protein